MAAGSKIDAVENARLDALEKNWGTDPTRDWLDRDLAIARGAIQELADQKIPLTWKDGTAIIANGSAVYAFNSTKEQFVDTSLFNGLGDGLYGELRLTDKWAQYGREQADAHATEIINVSTNDLASKDAMSRLLVLGRKSAEPVTALDDALLSLAGVRLGAKISEIVAAALAKRKLATEGSGELLVLGEKTTPSGLVSGETGVVGTGKAAANDASFDGAKGPHGTTVAEEVSGIRSLGDPSAGQLNIDRIRPVNGRSPINSQKYANTEIPLSDLPAEIAQKYPKSVHFSGAGYPDFTPYAVKKVRIDLTESRDRDFKLANQSSGYKRTPDNFTWHHHQESGLMQLIPSDLHDAVRHTGGVATSGIKPYK
ncbi:HNH endonuclease [Pseudomonas sp. S3_A03]